MPLRRTIFMAPFAAMVWAPSSVAAATGEVADPVRRGRTLRFPRDHGRHAAARIEWWYLTGHARAADGREFGFQITFFCTRTGLDAATDTRPALLAPTHLLLAHAALTDLGGRAHRHAQRIARHGRRERIGLAQASDADTRLRMGDWSLLRDAGSGAYRLQVEGAADEPAFELTATPTQPQILQGDQGWSAKGTGNRSSAPAASHYYSQPQLRTQGRLRDAAGRWQAVSGLAWLDHEWSDGLLPEGAVGWDWIGINLDDGGALMAFQLRDAGGTHLGAGGSHRSAAGVLTVFDAQALRFTPLAHWRSHTTGGRYPLRWRIESPVGRFEVHALLDDQELDTRAGTGTAYWEGLAECRDAGGRPVGRGYLEMTGYAGALKL